MFLRSRIYSALVLITLLWTLQSQAALFRNAYISFELPPDWDCKLDGTEWVCVSKFAKQSKEAIIILAAKEAGPADNFTSYKEHLKTPRLLHDKSGKVTPSKLLNEVKERTIANHPWIDAMHLGSEIPSYYTRYLATIKDRLAILVTFSAHKEHYTKYSKDFLTAIESIRVVASKDLLETKTNTPGFVPRERVGTEIATSIMGPDVSSMPDEPKDNDIKTKVMALILLVGGIGFYLWRRRQKK
jgi:hypothetical protein